MNLKRRPADEVIGDCYMQRWHIRRKPGGHNLYLHRYDGSDDDRALHDHPWHSISILLWGKLAEVTSSGEHQLWPWMPKFRNAKYTHRVLLKSKRAYTLFFTFPKIREWGFHSAHGWVHWREFIDDDGNTIDVA